MRLNPEVYKAIREDFHPKKLIVTALVVFVLALLILIVVSSSPLIGLALVPETEAKLHGLLKAFFYLQMVIMGLWGGKEIIDQVISDKVSRSWDFIRMTPQSDRMLCAGRIVGPALFPTYVAACLLPAILFLYSASHSVTLKEIILSYLSLFNAVAFVWLVSLSAIIRYKMKNKPGVFMALLIFLFMMASSMTRFHFGGLGDYGTAYSQPYDTMGDYLQRQYNFYWLNQIALFLGVIWMYFTARWNMLFELSVRPKFLMTLGIILALPLILVFRSVVDENGKDMLGLVFYWPLAVLAFCLCFIDEEGIERYQKWLLAKKNQFNEMPIWIIAVGALIFGALVAPLMPTVQTTLFQNNPRLLMYGLYLGFTAMLIRDFLILHLISLYVGKHARILGIAVLVIIHTITSVVLPFIIGKDGSAYFSDVVWTPDDASSSFVWVKLTLNFVQAAVLAYFFAKEIRRRVELSSGKTVPLPL